MCRSQRWNLHTWWKRKFFWVCLNFFLSSLGVIQKSWHCRHCNFLKPSLCSLCTGCMSTTGFSDSPDSVCLLIKMPRSTSLRLRNQKRRKGNSSFQHSSAVCVRVSRMPACDLEHTQGCNHTAVWLSVTQQANRSLSVEREAEVKWSFWADSSLCCASSLLVSSVRLCGSVVTCFLNFWISFFCCCFRLRVCGKHHHHSGDRRDFDLQIWHLALREASCLLGPGGHPQQRLR